MELPTSDFHKQSIKELDTTKLLTNAARQRDARNYSAFPIVDVDCHHYENESIREIVEYFDDPVIKQMGQLYTGGGTGGQTPFNPGLVGYQDVAGRVIRYPLRKTETTPADGKHRDVHLSLRWMDAMGVDYVCMFPTPMLSLGLHPQAEIEAAMAKGYNRWLAELNRAAPKELRWVVCPPLHAMDKVREELKFGKDNGACGIFVRAMETDRLPSNPYFYPLYEMAEEFDMPICLHSGIASFTIHEAYRTDPGFFGLCTDGGS